MSKYISANLIQEIQKRVGSTQTSRARKKARIIACVPHLLLKEMSLPSVSSKSYPLDGTPFILQNGPYTFSKKRLDTATQLLIQHFPKDLSFQNKTHQVLDFGCGNGALGIAYSHVYPHAKMTFTDVSFQAIHYAQLNFRTAFSHLQSDLKAA